MKRLRPWPVHRRNVHVFRSIAASLTALWVVGLDAQQPQQPARSEPRRAAQPQLLSLENEDIFAVAVGGEIFFFFGPDRMTSASATVFYAPDITTFGNAESVSDVMLQFETPLTEAVQVFVGYRWFRFDLPAQTGVDSSDRNVDKGVNLGITYRF